MPQVMPCGQSKHHEVAIGAGLECRNVSEKTPHLSQSTDHSEKVELRISTAVHIDLDAELIEIWWRAVIV